jgi:hypothetical protein
MLNIKDDESNNGLLLPLYIVSMVYVNKERHPKSNEFHQYMSACQFRFRLDTWISYIRY